MIDILIITAGVMLAVTVGTVGYAVYVIGHACCGEDGEEVEQ